MPVILGGNTGIYLASLTPSVDPDAQAFITAAAITDPTQQAAINTLVVDLKGYNVWTKMKALYPFVGSTASQQKFNLKDPRDLNAAFRLQFFGGWTHSSNGATPNGTNALAHSFLTPSVTLATNSIHFSKYNRTNDLIGNKVDGVYDGIGPFYLQQNYSAANSVLGNLTSLISYTQTDTRGLFTATRTATNVSKVFKNSTQQGSTNTATITAIPSSPIYIGGRNANNVAVDFFNTYQCAFASIGDGLTDTEVGNLRTAVQTFQTTLGRSIGTQTVSDADAQAFVTAADIQDQVEANAINNLVIGMKADGTWSKMKAVYPMVGGTSSTHKFNLKNPLDTDAAFRLTFSGGWTHSNNGATPNGTNAFANSFFAPSTNLSLNNAHVSFYSRSNTVSNTSMIGLNPSPSTDSYINLYPSFAGNMFFRMNSTGTSSIAVSTSTDGYYIVNRISSTEIRCSKNATTFIQAAVSGALSSSTIRLGGDGIEWDNRQCAFATIGDGLTDTDRTNLNSRVTTFQTALNRNI